jgi:hypothetical protein
MSNNFATKEVLFDPVFLAPVSPSVAPPANRAAERNKTIGSNRKEKEEEHKPPARARNNI